MSDDELEGDGGAENAGAKDEVGGRRGIHLDAAGFGLRDDKVDWSGLAAESSLAEVGRMTKLEPTARATMHKHLLKSHGVMGAG